MSYVWMGDGPGLGREALCSEVQCIMGNGHKGPPSPSGMTDRHPATSLAGGKNYVVL